MHRFDRWRLGLRLALLFGVSMTGVGCPPPPPPPPPPAEHLSFQRQIALDSDLVDVALVAGTIFVADGTTALRRIDPKTGESLDPIEMVDGIVALAATSAHSLAVFMVDEAWPGSSEARLVDVRDPASPGFHGLPSLPAACAQAVAGPAMTVTILESGEAWVHRSGDSAARPLEIEGAVVAATVDGDRAFVATSDPIAVHEVRIAGADGPRVAATFEPAVGSIHGLLAVGEWLVIGGTSPGLTYVDISSAGIGATQAGANLQAVHGLASVEGYLYAARGTLGLEVYDVESATRTAIIAEYDGADVFAVRADAEWVVGAEDDRTLRVWKRRG